jgi:hypothetical protein
LQKSWTYQKLNVYAVRLISLVAAYKPILDVRMLEIGKMYEKLQNAYARKRRARELYELNKAAVNKSKQSMKVAMAMVAAD